MNSIFNIQGNKNDTFITEGNNINNNIDFPINSPQHAAAPYPSNLPLDQKKK